MIKINYIHPFFSDTFTYLKANGKKINVIAHVAIAILSGCAARSIQRFNPVLMTVFCGTSFFNIVLALEILFPNKSNSKDKDEKDYPKGDSFISSDDYDSYSRDDADWKDFDD